MCKERRENVMRKRERERDFNTCEPVWTIFGHVDDLDDALVLQAPYKHKRPRKGEKGQGKFN